MNRFVTWHRAVTGHWQYDNPRGGPEAMSFRAGRLCIPIGAVHRLLSPGKIPVELIEVQSGAYLGEDDIERLQDHYGRTAAAGDETATPVSSESI